MPNINAVLNEQIRRLARRETRSIIKTVKRATAQYRRDIASLKRQAHSLTQRLAPLEKAARQTLAPLSPSPEVLEKGRFRSMGVKAHRGKLGLSAGDYGKLVGVSKKTIYDWEAGKSKPRNKLMAAKWLAVRAFGKREALQRLGLTQTVPTLGGAPTLLLAGKRRKRGIFKQTAEQMILSLLKARKLLTTSQINATWRQEGRGGAADTTLGRLVQARKLKRQKIKGGRGSTYRVI